MRSRLPALFVTAAILLCGPVGAQEAPAETETPEEPTVIVSDPSLLPGGKLAEGWYMRIETSEGPIVARLHPEQAPQSVAHFAALAEGRLEWTDVITGETSSGNYFDGMIVYRADASRSFETGDPHGTGASSPDIWVPPELERAVDFSMPWRIGLTRAPLGRISATQFFITAASLPELTHRHPCIGTVIEGKDVVRRITAVKTYSNGKPIEPITIHKLRVIKFGDAAPLPEPIPYRPPAGNRLQVKEGLSDRDR